MKEKRSFTVRGSVTKSRFTRKKFAISQFTGNKKGLSRVTKKPFTTLITNVPLGRCWHNTHKARGLVSFAWFHKKDFIIENDRDRPFLVDQLNSLFRVSKVC